MKKLIAGVAVAVFALFVTCPQVRAQRIPFEKATTVNQLSLLRPTQPINFDFKKSLTRVANPGALVASAGKSEMPGMPGMAGGGSTFPNNYSSAINSVGYDGNGTITLSYQFTGTTQSSPMCNEGAQHYPKVTINVLKNGYVTSSHQVLGTKQSPCSQMNQTVTVSFNFFSDSCDLAFFVDGTCTLAEQDDDVVCTVAGDFAFFAKHFQFEDAETDTVAYLPQPGPRYYQMTYCAPVYCPPDFTGPFDPEPDPGKVYWNEAILLRWAPVLQGFTGATWHYFIGLGNGESGYPDGPGGSQYPCTNKDVCDGANPPAGCGDI